MIRICQKTKIQNSKKLSNFAQQRNKNSVQFQKIDEFFFNVNELIKNVENDDNFEINLNISNEFMIEFVAVSMILTQVKISKFKKKQSIVSKNDTTVQNIAAVKTTAQRHYEKIKIKKIHVLLKRQFQKTETNETTNFSKKSLKILKTNRKIKLMNEKFFVINISNKYKNINEKKFDIYVKKMKTVFQIRFIIYETNKQKILFAQKNFEKIFRK